MKNVNWLLGYYCNWGFQWTIFVFAVDFKADIVDVEVNKIDDVMIEVKKLAVISFLMDMTPCKILAAEITEIVIDNWGWQYQ